MKVGVRLYANRLAERSRQPRSFDPFDHNRPFVHPFQGSISWRLASTTGLILRAVSGDRPARRRDFGRVMQETRVPGSGLFSA